MSDISKLFIVPANSSELKSYLKRVANNLGLASIPDPDIKAYPDIVYFNYYSLGLSLLFVPCNGYSPKTTALDYDRLLLDGVDIFNVIDSSTSKRPTYSRFPLLPMKLGTGDDHFELQSNTTGQDFVRALGEPTRKGGGTGPSSGSISIWCEWSKLGLMIEFGGNEATGPQAWEKGKDAKWKVATFFPPIPAASE